MSTAENQVTKRKSKRVKRTRVVRQLGVATDDTVKIVRMVRRGFPIKSLTDFQKATGLTGVEISSLVAIPQRTLTRRQDTGKLQPDESDRLLRASRIFDMAADLFEGNIDAARKWLQSPQPGLGGETPLRFASTEVGSREVENLIGRLEHGVLA